MPKLRGSRSQNRISEVSRGRDRSDTKVFLKSGIPEQESLTAFYSSASAMYLMLMCSRFFPSFFFLPPPFFLLKCAIEILKKFNDTESENMNGHKLKGPWLWSSLVSRASLTSPRSTIQSPTWLWGSSCTSHPSANPEMGENCKKNSDRPSSRFLVGFPLLQGALRAPRLWACSSCWSNKKGKSPYRENNIPYGCSQAEVDRLISWIELMTPEMVKWVKAQGSGFQPVW